MAALEQQLGVTLFDRKRRPPRLTRAGAIVLRRAKAIVAQYDDIFDALAEARPYRGSFRLGVIPTVLTNLLPAALMTLRDNAQQAVFQGVEITNPGHGPDPGVLRHPAGLLALKYQADAESCAGTCAVAHHIEIARLENLQRQKPARHQHGSQGEDGGFVNH